MSVCAHDPNCPGFGDEHDRATSTETQTEVYRTMAQDEMTITRAIHEVNNFTPEEVEAALAQRGAPTESEEEAAVQDFIETFGEFKSIFSSQPRNTVVNPGKDRSLSGKDRKRARREQRRGGLSDK